MAGIEDKEAQADSEEIKEEAREYARSTARDARFCIQVASSPLFTCALTGDRLTTVWINHSLQNYALTRRASDHLSFPTFDILCPVPLPVPAPR